MFLNFFYFDKFEIYNILASLENVQLDMNELEKGMKNCQKEQNLRNESEVS